MNEIYQVHDTHGCPKIADNIYCFQLSSPEPVMWRASPPFDVARPNWRPFNSPNTYRAPLLTLKPQLHDISHWQTEDLASSVLFRSWWMLESKFTSQDPI